MQRVAPLTFLFTDIVGSSSLWERAPLAMTQALELHNQVLADAIASHSGRIFKNLGDGVCAVFDGASDAIEACLAIQRGIDRQAWVGVEDLTVRIAVHSGDAIGTGDDYFGPTLNRCARILMLGHGGQALLSLAVKESAKRLQEGAKIVDLGIHRLRDLSEPEHIFQLSNAGHQDEFPPIRSVDDFPNNLPAEVSSFVGRTEAIRAVKALILKNRLVTLSGSGGAGKTRLALRVAAEVLEEFEDGVWIAQLAAVADSGLVPTTVASVLGVLGEPLHDLTDTLAAELRHRKLLLLLDNCDHLVAECHRLVAKLLPICPGLRVLATSREVLNVAGEVDWRVPPLTLPTGAQLTAQQIQGYESVQLFHERASATKNRFAITDQNAAAVAEICTRLDGIPLAIELAAARVKVLSPEQIAERLNDRFRLLARSAGNVPPRQQTLRATIEWSYDLLTPDEQDSFCRFAAFVGGFSLAASEAVAGDATHEPLEMLTRLVDKSLVTSDSYEDEVRFRLLESIREFGWEKLSVKEFGTDVSRRHAHTYRDLVFGSDDPERLDLEYGNIRAALNWLAANESDQGLELAVALAPYWRLRGHVQEAQQRLAGLLDRATAAPGPIRARALIAAGTFSTSRSEFKTAQFYLEKGLEQSSKIGDEAEIGNALNAMGNLEYTRGHFARAGELYEESLVIRRKLGDRSAISASLCNLGSVARMENRANEGLAFFEESLAIDRELGDSIGIGTTLCNIGVTSQTAGDTDRARKCFDESLAIERSIGNRPGLARTLHNRAMLAQHVGDLDLARSLYQESLAIRTDIGDRSGVAMALNNLGFLALGQGDAETSKGHFRESLVAFHQLGIDEGVAACLEGLGQSACEREEWERATLLFGAAAAIREVESIPLPANEVVEHEKRMADLRSRLEPQPFDRNWLHGRAMPMEELIAFAIEN